jgi:hypothetical protein
MKMNYITNLQFKIYTQQANEMRNLHSKEIILKSK